MSCDQGQTAIPRTGLLTLVCAASGDVLASVPIEPATVNVARRLIGGLAIPYNVVGSPSIGRARFRPGSVTVPTDPTRAKLLVEHDVAQSVGHMAEHEDFPSGLLASYQVIDGPAGDAALANAANRSRDGLSIRVEVDAFEIMPGDIVDVISSRLRETSLVAIPAYDDARATVLAAATTQERETIMARLAGMLDLKASAPQPTHAAPAPDPAPAPAPALAPAPAPAPATTAPVAPALDMAVLAAALAPHFAQLARPEAPAGPPVIGSRQGLATVHAAAQAVVDWQTGGSGNVGELLAALSDVVPANDAGQGLGPTRPQWLGELWTASESRRPFIDALGTPQKLTGLKVQGWRWVTRPAVADYAGNKAAIPSNAVSTEPAEANAHRVAGGWDVDRVFVDLGDVGMIASMFTAATEDYRRKSNAYCGAQLVAGATGAAIDAVTLAAALVEIGTAAGQVGAALTFLAVAPDVFGEFAGMTRDEVPFWFGSGDGVDIGTSSGRAGGMSFWADPSLTAGTYLGGDRRAATYYEEGATPIRVQAVNIPNGGVDLGVFGYNAVIVNDDRALFHGTIG